MKHFLLITALAICIAHSASGQDISQFPPRATAPTYPTAPVAILDETSISEFDVNAMRIYRPELDNDFWSFYLEQGEDEVEVTVLDEDLMEIDGSPFTFSLDNESVIYLELSPNLLLCIGTDDADEIVIERGYQGIVFAGSGDDRVTGAEHRDYIFLGHGNDYCEGNAGDDIVVGGYGDDTIKGQGGEDQLFGGNGIDKLYGGDDTDILVLEGVESGQLAVGNGGGDIIWGSGHTDSLYGDEETANKHQNGGEDIIYTVSVSPTTFLTWG